MQTDKCDGPVHRYLASSPGCWARFGELLVREYENPQYMAVHGLTVDAYALQHPGQESPQTISSAHVHLGSLYSYFELGKPITQLPQIKQELTRFKSRFTWLTPPDDMALITVADVLLATSAAEHCAAVEKWAAYLYERWAVHHPTIARVVALCNA